MGKHEGGERAAGVEAAEQWRLRLSVSGDTLDMAGSA